MKNIKILDRNELIKKFNSIGRTEGVSRYTKVFVDRDTLVFIHQNGVGVKRIWDNASDDRVSDYHSLFNEVEGLVELL